MCQLFRQPGSKVTLYIELAMQGDDTIDTRLEMFRHQREVLTQQIRQLQHTLETVEYKCWFYETAKAAGTVDIPSCPLPFYGQGLSCFWRSSPAQPQTVPVYRRFLSICSTLL